MCSPRLRDGPNALRTPEDLRHHTLLHDDSLDFDSHAPKWGSWLTAVGVAPVDQLRETHFSHPDHSLQAAIDGVGVALGWRSLAAADLVAGRLVAPFDLALPLGLDFHLVYPETYADRPKIAKFRQWLLQEVARAKEKAIDAGSRQ